MSAAHALLWSVAFLTLLPVPRWVHGRPPAMGWAAAGFPVTGALIGAAAGAAALLADGLFGPAVGGVLAAITAAALSRGLHLDGLADAADGLFAGDGPERRMETMRDSRIGAFGATAVFCALALKATAFGTLLVVLAGARAALVLALALAFALGRWSMIVSAGLARAARSEGAGAFFIGRARRWHAAPASAAPAALVIVLAAVSGRAVVACAGGAAWLVALGTVLLFGALCRRKIGGHTGDTLGAAGEIAETVAALAVLGVMRRFGAA